MSDEIIPPLGDERPAGAATCGRAVGPDINRDLCDKPATWHVMWADNGENGIVCERHYNEARKHWTIYDAHPFGGVCTMLNTFWLPSWEEPPGRCLWVVDEATLAMDRGAAMEAVS